MVVCHHPLQVDMTLEEADLKFLLNSLPSTGTIRQGLHLSPRSLQLGPQPCHLLLGFQLGLNSLLDFILFLVGYGLGNLELLRYLICSSLLDQELVLGYRDLILKLKELGLSPHC